RLRGHASCLAILRAPPKSDATFVTLLSYTAAKRFARGVGTLRPCRVLTSSLAERFLMKLIGSVCVYCGSNGGTDPRYEAAARDFGRMLAEGSVRLVYGGGGLGLM